MIVVVGGHHGGGAKLNCVFALKEVIMVVQLLMYYCGRGTVVQNVGQAPVGR